MSVALSTAALLVLHEELRYGPSGRIAAWRASGSMPLSHHSSCGTHDQSFYGRCCLSATSSKACKTWWSSILGARVEAGVSESVRPRGGCRGMGDGLGHALRAFLCMDVWTMSLRKDAAERRVLLACMSLRNALWCCGRLVGADASSREGGSAVACSYCVCDLS